MPESIAEFMPAPVLWIMNLGAKKKLPRDAVVEYQYATALPIGTALAQSWNLELARECGDIVGTEMVRFGIHLWLLPP